MSVTSSFLVIYESTSIYLHMHSICHHSYLGKTEFFLYHPLPGCPHNESYYTHALHPLQIKVTIILHICQDHK